MSVALFMERGGKVLTLISLFLLPWQTRYMFWAPWVGTTESEFGVISLYVTMLLAGGAAISWWMSGVLGAKEERRQTTDSRYLLSFICSLLSAVYFLVTFPSPAHAWILNVTFSLLLGYATYKTAQQNSRATIYAVLAGLIPAVGLGIWQMSAGWSPASSWLGLASRSAEHLGDSVLIIEGQRILRMYGSFPHPNIFGTAIALMFGVMTSVSFRLRPRVQQVGGGEIFIIPMLIAGVLFCISRSAALAMTCAMLVSYGVLQKKKALIGIACMLPIVVWSLQFISPSLLALRGQSFTEQQSISERVAQVGEWWQVMRQDGLWGTGIYQYPQARADIQGGSLPAWAYQPVHNVFLLVIAELGIVGCGVVGIGLLMVIKTADNRRKIADKRCITSAVRRPSSFICRLLSTIFHLSFLPLLVTLFSLSWFDHALWTSWSGMSYTAVAIALVFAEEQSRISTLGQGVLDEKK